MQKLLFLQLTFLSFLLLSCVAISNHVLPKAPAPKSGIDLNDSIGCPEYRHLIDSLCIQLSDTSYTDSLILLVRPCYTTKGLLIKKNNHRFEETFFKKVEGSTIVSKVKKTMANDVLSSLNEVDKLRPAYKDDSIVIIPGCPLIIFVKTKGEKCYSFNDNEIIFYSEKISSFRKIVAELKRH